MDDLGLRTRVGSLREAGDEPGLLCKPKEGERGLWLEPMGGGIAWLMEHRRDTASHAVIKDYGFPYPWIGKTLCLGFSRSSMLGK